MSDQGYVTSDSEGDVELVSPCDDLVSAVRSWVDAAKAADDYDESDPDDFNTYHALDLATARDAAAATLAALVGDTP